MTDIKEDISKLDSKLSKGNSGLSEKEEVFARKVAAGYGQTEAARQAGYAENGITVQATRLMKKAKIQRRIDQLTAIPARESFDERREHLEELAALRQMAKAKGQTAAAIKAEELRGRVLGLYVERSLVEQKGGTQSLEVASPGDLRAAIAEAVERLGLDSVRMRAVDVEPEPEENCGVQAKLLHNAGEDDG